MSQLVSGIKLLFRCHKTYIRHLELCIVCACYVCACHVCAAIYVQPLMVMAHILSAHLQHYGLDAVCYNSRCNPHVDMYAISDQHLIDAAAAATVTAAAAGGSMSASSSCNVVLLPHWICLTWFSTIFLVLDAVMYRPACLIAYILKSWALLLLQASEC